MKITLEVEKTTSPGNGHWWLDGYGIVYVHEHRFYTRRVAGGIIIAGNLQFVGPIPSTPPEVADPPAERKQLPARDEVRRKLILRGIPLQLVDEALEALSGLGVDFPWWEPPGTHPFTPMTEEGPPAEPSTPEVARVGICTLCRAPVGNSLAPCPNCGSFDFTPFIQSPTGANAIHEARRKYADFHGPNP